LRSVLSKIGLILTAGILTIMLFGGSCVPSHSFDSRLRSIVKPYRFSVVVWEFRSLPQIIGERFLGRAPEIEDEIGVVKDYFVVVGRIKSLRSEIGAISVGSKTGDIAVLEAELNKLQGQRKVLDKAVEGIIGKQVDRVLAEQGIFNPMVKSKFRFPPLIFKLTEPPHLLVISPRDRIESMREIVLQPTIGLEEMEAVEAASDELGVSSLVVELGGFAAYPSIVTHNADRRFIIDTVAEEWLHQYLNFKPLGFRYLLDLAGIARNYEIATMNETVAGMVSKEIGGLVDKEYCAEGADLPPPVSEPGFDFNREMREIRGAVDRYLERGEIEPAEEYMEQKRRFIVSKGYDIRKLNQAYFAFHGAYADQPVSISPIGVELRELRERSDSLKDFLETVAAMSSRQELSELLKAGGPVP